MQITDQAKTFVENIMEEKGAENLKVFLVGMNCGSPQIGLALDPPEEKDAIATINGISVAFEPNLKEQTEHITLDCQMTPEGEGLVLSGNAGGCC